VAALGEEVPDAKYDAKQLVSMLVNILHFQEAALGIGVSADAGSAGSGGASSQGSTHTQER
jgi:hypothetical protein